MISVWDTGSMTMRDDAIPKHRGPSIVLTCHLQALSSERRPRAYVRQWRCGDPGPDRPAPARTSPPRTLSSEEKAMKRRTVLQAALAGTAALAVPHASRAQTSRKLSYLTWNIADQEQLFKEEFADFRGANPGLEIEW